MPGCFDGLIVEAFFQLALAYVFYETCKPPHVEIRRVKIGRLVPRYSVIAERRTNKQQRSEEQDRR
jgi:hypothetical protein